MNDQLITENKIGIVNVLQTGTAFGVTGDGSGVYIPQAVAAAAHIKLGDEVNAKLVKNLRDPNGRTPFLAVWIESNQMSQDVAKATTEDILDMLYDGYMTTAEVAAEVGIDSQSANAILSALHNEGRVVRAAAYQTPKQQRASLVLWALDLSAFTGE